MNTPKGDSYHLLAPRSPPPILRTPTDIPQNPTKRIFTTPLAYANKEIPFGVRPSNFYGKLLITCTLEDNSKDLCFYLEKGGDPNYIEQENGFTPLYLSVKYNLPECVCILLDNGALMTLSTEKEIGENNKICWKARDSFQSSNFDTEVRICPLEYAFKYLDKDSRVVRGMMERLKWLDENYAPAVEPVPGRAVQRGNELGSPYHPFSGSRGEKKRKGPDEEEEEEEDREELTHRKEKRQRVEATLVDDEEANGDVEDNEGPVEIDNEHSRDTVVEEIDLNNLEKYTDSELEQYCQEENITADNKTKAGYIEAILRRETGSDEGTTTVGRGEELWRKLMRKLGFDFESPEQNEGDEDTSKIEEHAKKLAAQIEDGGPTESDIDDFVASIKEHEKSAGKRWWSISERELTQLKMWPWFNMKGKRTSRVSRGGLSSLG